MANATGAMLTNTMSVASWQGLQSHSRGELVGNSLRQMLLPPNATHPSHVELLSNCK